MIKTVSGLNDMYIDDCYFSEFPKIISYKNIHPISTKYNELPDKEYIDESINNIQSQINDIQLIQGATGPQGFTGPQGVQGVTGPNGQNGQNGQDGQDGISFIWRGTYNSSNNYYVNDVVFYDNSSYMCIQEKNASNVTLSFASCFTLLAKQGDKGERGSNGSDGSDGSDGGDGKDGKDGSNGSNGADAPGIAAIVAALLEGAVLAGVVADVTALNTSVATITLDLAALTLRVSTLETKTQYQNIITPNATTFSCDLDVVGSLNASNTITTSTSITTPTIKTNNIDYQFSNGSTLNIGKNGSFTGINEINIGGIMDNIYINGSLYQPPTTYYVNNYINQFG